MIGTILGLIVGYILAILINGGILWVLCWGLNEIGIHVLFGWTVCFSWPLAVVFTIVYTTIYALFHSNK
jgi:hypothetical protein